MSVQTSVSTNNNIVKIAVICGTVPSNHRFKTYSILLNRGVIKIAILIGYKYRKRLPRKEKKALSKKVKRETLNDLLKIEADVIEPIIEIVGYMNRRIGANIHSKIMRNFKELYNIKKKRNIL